MRVCVGGGGVEDDHAVAVRPGKTSLPQDRRVHLQMAPNGTLSGRGDDHWILGRRVVGMFLLSLPPFSFLTEALLHFFRRLLFLHFFFLWFVKKNFLPTYPAHPQPVFVVRVFRTIRNTTHASPPHGTPHNPPPKKSRKYNEKTVQPPSKEDIPKHTKARKSTFANEVTKGTLFLFFITDTRAQTHATHTHTHTSSPLPRRFEKHHRGATPVCVVTLW